MVTGHFGPIPVRTPDFFGPIPFQCEQNFSGKKNKKKTTRD